MNKADHKPAKWLRYVDHTLVVWPHGPARLQDFFFVPALTDLPSNLQWFKFNYSVPGRLGHEEGSQTGHERVLETYLYRSLSAVQVQPPTSREKGSP